MAAAAQGVFQRRSDRLRIARLLCAFGVMFFTGGAIAERPQGVSKSNSDEASGEARGRVTISPSTPAARVYRTHAPTGRVEIRAATLDAATFIANGKEPDFGVIKVGKRADLLLVDGDPSADVGVLENFREVFVDGVALVRKPVAIGLVNR